MKWHIFSTTYSGANRTGNKSEEERFFKSECQHNYWNRVFGETPKEPSHTNARIEMIAKVKPV